MIEVWRGAVDPAECDELGHMNVRRYVARAMDGLAGIAAALGSPEAFSPRGTSTLVPREHHIRFLKEARSGAPLHLTAGLLDIGETEATVLQVLTHSVSGQPCAAFTTRIAHATTREPRAFPWSAEARERAEALKTDAPDWSRPRGVTTDPLAASPTLEAAEAAGMAVVGRGVTGPEDCDVFGRLRADVVMGRFSSAAAQLFGGLVAEAGALRLGRALVEARYAQPGRPGPGSHWLLRSGLTALADKTFGVRHWLFDSHSGEMIAAAEALGVTVDLDRRQAIVPPPADRARLEQLMVR